MSHTINDSTLIAQNIIETLMSQFSTQINNQKIKLKLAPINARKSALYALESLNLMQTKFIQLPEKVPKVQKSKCIKLDAFAIKKVGIKMKKSFELKIGEVPRSLLKTKTSCFKDRRANISESSNKNKFETEVYKISRQKFKEMNKQAEEQCPQNLKYKTLVSSKHTSKRGASNNKRSSKLSSNRFYKISSRKFNTISDFDLDLTDQADDDLIEAIKKRKFFIEEEQILEKQRTRLQQFKYLENFSEKCEKMKKIKDRLSFDYSGEFFQSKQTIKGPLDILELSGKPDKINKNRKESGNKTEQKLRDKQIRLDQKQSQRISISNRICTVPTNSNQKKNEQQINQIQFDDRPELLEPGLDPVSQITEQNISEGVKIFGSSSNILRQKLTRMNPFSQRFQNLKQYKEYKQGRPFRQYTLSTSPKDSLTMEVQMTDNCKTLQNTKNSQCNANSGRLKNEREIINTERMKKSILESQKRKFKELGQIMISNNRCYDELFENDQAQ